MALASSISFPLVLAGPLAHGIHLLYKIMIGPSMMHHPLTSLCPGMLEVQSKVFLNVCCGAFSWHRLKLSYSYPLYRTMRYMFSKASKFTGQGLNSWDTSKVRVSTSLGLAMMYMIIYSLQLYISLNSGESNAVNVWGCNFVQW